MKNAFLPELRVLIEVVMCRTSAPPSPWFPMTEGEWRSTRVLVKSGYLEKFDLEYRPTELGKVLAESCLALMRGWPEERKKTKRRGRSKPVTDLTGAEEAYARSQEAARPKII